MEEQKKHEIKSLFVSYEQALALKELGFDEYCLRLYINEQLGIKPYDESNRVVNAPLYQQAFRWFREKSYDFAIFDKHKDLGKFYGGYISDGMMSKSFGSNFKSYEEAESACLDKLIEIVKSKQ